MEEIWKDIPGFEGIYQASTHGRVKGLARMVIRSNGSPCSVKENYLTPSTNKDGYKYVLLSNCGKTYTFRVHRLVALTFIPNEHNLPQINHKDEDKANNHVENLEWCTIVENCNHGTRNKRISLKGRYTDKTYCKKPVLMYDKGGHLLRKFDSVIDAERFTGINSSSIVKCCKRKPHCNTAGGYKWNYKQQDL